MTNNPYWGKWNRDDEPNYHNEKEFVKLKTVYLCKSCNKNVMAYQYPIKCSDHDEPLDEPVTITKGVTP